MYFVKAFAISQYLDAEFDAPDEAADRELCRAIMAGKAGLHPDGWGNHDPLTKLPPQWRREPDYAREHHPSPADLRWEAQHRPRPVEEPRRPRGRPPASSRTPSVRQEGELQLTCDECGERYAETMPYNRGRRDRSVEAIRLRAKKYGWTCTVGRDRCPRCSQFAPPDAVGNGAGEGEGHEQHANSG